jgi:hypothetical protein
MTTAILSRPLVRLLDELAADGWLRDMAGPFRTALEATELESDDNPDAAAMMQCFGLIAEQPRPLRDRLRDIHEILDAPRGKITVTIRRSV